MLKYPKSIREIIPADSNFFIKSAKKINLKNISGDIISSVRKKIRESDLIIFEETLQQFFLKNPFRRQINLKRFKHLAATLIANQLPILRITTPGIKDEPEFAISINFAIISHNRENYDYITSRYNRRK